MPNYDLTNLALKALCPNNELLYDDKGIPSVMVKIPKQTLADLGIGTSTTVHPAFKINGSEVDALYISKYQNVVNNSRAYSLPGRAPQINVNFDNAANYCKNKGTGWHLMTRAEWALLALWCKKNGTQPLGNNTYGRDSTESVIKAIPLTYTAEGKTMHVATGTGPLTWSHDRTPSGIWDLNGNVWEWVGGLRTVYGEVQVLADNNAADNTKLQTAASTEWKAIDATTGDYITPDGSGTTENSIKIDFISNKVTYSTSITSKTDTSRSCAFANATCDDTISDAAKETLYALAILPNDTVAANYNGDWFYFNNGAAERSFGCGGHYGNGTNAGVFYLSGYYSRTAASSGIGFRSAFVELPTA